MKRLQRILSPLSLASVALLAACGGSGSASTSFDDPGTGSGGGVGQITIEATDAPFDHDLLTEALVRVDLVRIHSEDTGWLTLFEGGPLEIDLLALRNGITRTLVLDEDLPAGSYGKLRLRAHSAALELINGNYYATADGNLHLTSTGTSGFQLNIDPPLEIVDAVSTDLLLDFDLSKTFHPVPANDPLTATTFQLKKGIRVANLSETGELRGSITTDDGATPVDDASVFVLVGGDTDLSNAVASTASDDNGLWAVLGLPPGTYDVYARKRGTTGSTLGADVNVGSATLVDVDLE